MRGSTVHINLSENERINIEPDDARIKAEYAGSQGILKVQVTLAGPREFAEALLTREDAVRLIDELQQALVDLDMAWNIDRRFCEPDD